MKANIIFVLTTPTTHSDPICYVKYNEVWSTLLVFRSGKKKE